MRLGHFATQLLAFAYKNAYNIDREQLLMAFANHAIITH